MIKAAIIGATGYTGAELVRLLRCHPEVTLTDLTTQSYVGQSFADVYPHFQDQVTQVCCAQDLSAIAGEADVLFLALPHGLSVPWVVEARRLGKKVIDLGADFRFRQVQTYEQWYHVTHEAPELLSEAVYGLPELHRASIRQASIIGNPGCYPTASMLAMAPLLGQGLIDEGRIIIDAKSGVSGAGRKAVLGSLYAEVNENVKPYGVATHRHTPEIEQEASRLAGSDQAIKLSFTPHLMPMTRGILATVYMDLRPEADVTAAQVRERYQAFYAGETFVHVMDEGVWPQTKWSYGSNHAFIGVTVDRRTRRVIVASAIDNLIKGASGQAIQNMNLLFDLPETIGLTMSGIYP
ncbi:N-acetyl-gamma-glutamyl-phosphate reductase [Heliophilum fasciatum]|uniref:N-acetyl-gamma-glutamyl-phosphate reductase n=1 Tax=Heliophilum fasciatum TaxID=35700 RepID=A0A4R2RPK6_9FIRM|nr:N-acetyl-gamma-glutamyl-phosphate reductase [Heliophilum fasciatum]MCW2278979.1 N-acetyl-gamma-glutamyl-phosphate reductase [Heliophilum fasciatum]TCP61771.1 N-acetyl-gamma-glutamyl-phosphate reductase [Heliophilum fasciatum]